MCEYYAMTLVLARDHLRKARPELGVRAPHSGWRRLAIVALAGAMFAGACGSSDDSDETTTAGGSAAETVVDGLDQETTGSDAEDATAGNEPEAVAWAPAPTPTEPTIRTVVTPFDRVRIHSFVTPQELTATATHVIEGAESVVVVDGHASRGNAEAFRSYVDAIGKPVAKVILSHGHPDHWFGLEMAWGDHDVWADKTTIARIAEKGSGDIGRLGQLLPAEEIPAAPLARFQTLDPGPFDLDGVVIDVEVYESAEAPSQVVLWIEQAKVLVAQDLVYSDGHLFMGNDSFDGWVEVLGEIRDRVDDEWILLAGHGLPTTPKIIDAEIVYLQAAEKVRMSATNAEEFVAGVRAQYPDLPDELVLRFGANQLYSEGGFATTASAGISAASTSAASTSAASP